MTCLLFSLGANTAHTAACNVYTNSLMQLLMLMRMYVRGSSQLPREEDEGDCGNNRVQIF